MCDPTEKELDKMFDAEIEYQEMEARKTPEERLADLQLALANQARILQSMLITCDKIQATLKGERP